MFFIGIFGIQQKEKKVCILENLDCKHCPVKSSAYLLKDYSYFHIFFIPLFKWNENYYVVCGGCDHIYSIPKEKGKRVEAGDKDIISYWDLKDVSDRYGNKRCPSCSREVDTSFGFCPYCGNRL